MESIQHFTEWNDDNDVVRKRERGDIQYRNKNNQLYNLFWDWNACVHVFFSVWFARQYLHLASANVSVLEVKLSHSPLVVDAVEGSEASKSHSLDVLTAEPSAPACRWDVVVGDLGEMSCQRLECGLRTAWARLAKVSRVSWEDDLPRLENRASTLRTCTVWRYPHKFLGHCAFPLLLSHTNMHAHNRTFALTYRTIYNFPDQPLTFGFQSYSRI